MSIAIYKNKCNPAASARNVEYITRDRACDSISFHNLDELRDDDRIQAKSNAINYAEEREIEEEARIIGNERGTPRNHNRMILSFDRKEETEVAKQMAHEYLEKNFPNQKAIVSVHQDQEKTHIHCWFDCRNVETDRKTQIQPKDFYTLDEKWARQYDERYKTDYEREYTTKKRETFEWKREQYERTQGEAGKKELPENKPERHTDNKIEIIKAREDKEHGFNKNSDRTDKQPASFGREGITESERSFEQSKQTITQTQRAVDTSEQRAELSKLEHERGHKEFEATDRNFESTLREAQRASERIIERQRAEQTRQRSRDDDGYSR